VAGPDEAGRVKRLLWLGAGFGLGVTVARRRRRASVSGDTRSALATGWRARVDDAVSTGRDEMQRREATLRQLLAEPDRGTRAPER
jgi:hypothetical protein